MSPSSPEGLVLRVDAKACHVEVGGAQRLLPLAGKLFEERSHEKRPLAVGDRVLLDATGRAIEAVLPRSSQLHRRAASEGEERAQVIAANVTLVVATASVTQPPFQSEVVDSLLAAAAREHIPAVLVLTKCDLDADGAVRWRQLYESLGVRVLTTSTAAGVETRAALDELARLLHENRSVLCGLSGAGKSSLLNAVVPGLQLRIGTLNRIHQGSHTTSNTELIPLPGGGHVLDTPGVRSFHLFGVGSQELQFLFPEIGRLLPQCEYRSCLHDDESRACAVQAAVGRGEIAASRFDSYRRMLAAARAAETRSSAGEDAPRGGKRRRPR